MRGPPGRNGYNLAWTIGVFDSTRVLGDLAFVAFEYFHVPGVNDSRLALACKASRNSNIPDWRSASDVVRTELVFRDVAFEREALVALRP